MVYIRKSGYKPLAKDALLPVPQMTRSPSLEASSLAPKAGFVDPPPPAEEPPQQQSQG